MRLRNIPGSKEVIAESAYVIQEPQRNKGKWKEIFGNEHPLHIEVGMGKGRFIMDMASLHPECNYIGIEMYDSVLLRAVQKREQMEEELPNLFFVRMDARILPEVFAKGEVERIYLNFSDPWPKDRHAKRRLTSKEFLGRYDQILNKEGILIFKTDNRGLFDFSLEQVEEAGWNLQNYTFDLHHSEYLEGNIMTEYETRFVEEGKPICRMVISR